MFNYIYKQGIYELYFFFLVDRKELSLCSFSFFLFLFIVIIFNDSYFKNSQTKNDFQNSKKSIMILFLIFLLTFCEYLEKDSKTLIKYLLLFAISSLLYRNYKKYDSFSLNY